MGPFKCYKGGIQVLRNADGVEGVPNFPGKSVTMVYVSPLLALQGGGWGPIFREKRYVTLEWPQNIFLKN